MSSTRIFNRAVEGRQDFFPPGSTKLIITTCFAYGTNPPYWALLIVGAFYDSKDNPIWSTEIFVAHLNIQVESESESEAESETDSEAASLEPRSEETAWVENESLADSNDEVESEVSEQSLISESSRGMLLALASLVV